ncbi:MAG: hypothetical protein AB1486_15415 [Planctomycetota bacterium]
MTPFDRDTSKRLRQASLLFQIGIFEELLAQESDDLDILAELGELYTRAGEYEKGLAIDRRLVRLAPESPIAHYNLACSLARVSRPDEAFASLDRAVRLGYRDVAHLRRDPDLASLRGDARFVELVRRLSQS